MLYICVVDIIMPLGIKVGHFSFSELIADETWQVTLYATLSIYAMAAVFIILQFADGHICFPYLN